MLNLRHDSNPKYSMFALALKFRSPFNFVKVCFPIIRDKYFGGNWNIELCRNWKPDLVKAWTQKLCKLLSVLDHGWTWAF